MNVISTTVGKNSLEEISKMKEWSWFIYNANHSTKIQVYATITDAKKNGVDWFNEVLQDKNIEWVVCPSPEDLPDPGIKTGSPAWQTDSLPQSHQGSL